MGMISTLRMAYRAASEQADGGRDQHREPMSADWILQQVIGLTISTWGYTFEPANIVRLGPMAQAFYRAFRFGTTNKRIPVESALGVLMVCVQVLTRRLTSAEKEIAALRVEARRPGRPASAARRLARTRRSTGPSIRAGRTIRSASAENHRRTAFTRDIVRARRRTTPRPNPARNHHSNAFMP